MSHELNQNRLELRGMTAFNSFGDTVSASRAQMQASAFSQHYVINGAEPDSIQTGFSQEVGKYTYSIKTEHNIHNIVAIVDRYTPSSFNGIQFSPQRVVIYQTFDEDTSKPLYGIINIERVCSNHTKFGFPYKPTPDASNIRIGASIPKGTILYDSPAKRPDGNYCPGRELLTLYSSLEGTIEDSILVSKDIIGQIKTKVYVTRTMELGEKEFPLNLYGDDDNYKVIPDIGEYCRPTGEAYEGIIMAKREYRPELIPISFTKKSTRKFNPITDIGLDGNGVGARVIDIIVYKQNKTTSAVSDKVLAQLNKYADAYKEWCERILHQYKAIQANNHGAAEFTDEFDQLIRHCMAICNEPIPDTKGKSLPIQKVGNFNRKLDDIVVIVKTEYEKELGIGYKLTDIHGGKGVVAKTLPPEQMPYDPVTGLRAQVVISPETTNNRMNYGRIYEQTLKTSMLELRQWLINKTGLDEKSPNLKDSIIHLPKEVLQECFDRIQRFLEITVDKQFHWYKSLDFKDKTIDLYHVLKEKFYLYRPVDNPNPYLEMFDTLSKEGFLSPPRKLKYFNPYTGKEEETTLEHRIGPNYYIFLEKIGDEAAAVSTAATQPNGIIAPITSKDKARSHGARSQATRFPAESEIRCLISGAPSGIVAEIHDRSNNPTVIESILENIYSSDKPTNIESVIDRDKYPLGDNRSLSIVNHIFQCNGYRLAYKPFDPSQQSLSQLDPITGKPIMLIENDEEEEVKVQRKTKTEIILEGIDARESSNESDDDDDSDDDSDQNDDIGIVEYDPAAD